MTIVEIMALKKCKECDKEVSTKARNCPSCGVSNPTISNKRVLLGILVLSAIIASIFMIDTEIEKKPLSEVISQSNVDWSIYSSEVKERIFKNIELKNCLALQREQDTAYKNSDLNYNRTGVRNTNLMKLIDDSMRSIGCYD